MTMTKKPTLKIMSKPPANMGGSPKSPADHMAKRAKLMPQAKVAAEFGKSQPTVSRAVRRGYTNEGSASDEAADAKKA